LNKRCHSCNRQCLEHTRYCLKCYISESVRKTLGITDKQEKKHFCSILYLKLLKQSGECVYTGRQLIPGKNMSLDHVLPSSIYPEGLQEVDNLVWCDLTVNIAKNNLLPHNFLELCQDVVSTKSKHLISKL
jgi:hypothetical protein